jgi:uncharacterized membrane protein HdeD (DUF308 family)
MPAVLAANWWALVLRGIAAIIFGVLTFFWPGATIAVLVIFFGVYALIDGILAIVSAIRAAERHRRWGAFLMEGIVGILAGLFALFAPVAAAALFVYILAAWALITGALEIAAAIRLRRDIPGEWALILTGILSILFGVLLFIAPIAGAVALVWLIGVYAVLFGALWITVGIRLRTHPVYFVRPAGGVVR